MKNINKILYIYSALSLIIILFFLNNNMIENNEMLRKYNDDNVSYLYYCGLNMEFELSTKGDIVPDIVCVNRFDTSYLSHFVQYNPLLIFRYSNLHCKSCVEFANSILDSCFCNYYDKSIILYSSDFKQVDRAYKRVNKIKTNLYYVDKKMFYWEYEKYSDPYFFILYPNMKASDFFIPDPKYPEMTRMYIEGVKRLICNYK